MPQTHCRSAAYASRNKRKWESISSSPWHRRLARHHPLEGSSSPQSSSNGSPYAHLCSHGHAREDAAPDTVQPLLRTSLELPSSQLAHVAALLPGYEFAHIPGQLYLE